MFRTHCATCLHYIATLKIASIRYCKKIPTSVADVSRALSNIQPETIVVANIRSKKHPVARKEYKVIECAGIMQMKSTLYRFLNLETDLIMSKPVIRQSPCSCKAH